MSIYHCSIKIISRADGRSAVASAAYRSGEELYNEETGLIHDFTSKGGVFMSEILLPENAPIKYLNRELLWNDVQRIESRSDARLAREIEVALPVEMKRDDQIKCVREYIQENFTSKGMIADWAMHDKDDGNPHAHIMLTCRAFNEKQEWDIKTRSVFANDRDKEGRAIYNPDLPSYDPKDKESTAKYRVPQLDENGKQKHRIRPGKGEELLWERINIPTNDWNDKAKAEIWRESWARQCNKYLDLEHQIDHRSYERQGIDKEPTIHEGIAARQMESRGRASERIQTNREIREYNSLREQIRQLAREITETIATKARSMYERLTDLIRHRGNSGKARGDDYDSRGAADRDRGFRERERELERTGGRVNELKRDADEADKRLQRSTEEIERTEQEIERTNQRIRELRELSQRKERERDERLQKLKERRAADNAGRPADRDRGSEGREQPASSTGLRSTADDIRSFLASIDAREQSAAAERSHRESERQRQATAARKRDVEKNRRREDRDQER